MSENEELHTVVADLSAENDQLFLQVEEMRRECGIAWSLAAGTQPAELGTQLAEPETQLVEQMKQPADVMASQLAKAPEQQADEPPARAAAAISSPAVTPTPGGLPSASHPPTSLFVTHASWAQRKPFVSYARQLLIVQGHVEMQPRYRG